MRTKDYRGFFESFAKAYSVAPHHLTVAYYYAAGAALVGKDDLAFRLLDRLAGVGADFGIKEGTLFESIQGDSRFSRILSRLEEASKPVSTSAEAFRIPERDLLTEGVAHDRPLDPFM